MKGIGASIIYEITGDCSCLGSKLQGNSSDCFRHRFNPWKCNCWFQTEFFCRSRHSSRLSLPLWFYLLTPIFGWKKWVFQGKGSRSLQGLFMEYNKPDQLSPFYQANASIMKAPVKKVKLYRYCSVALGGGRSAFLMSNMIYIPLWMVRESFLSSWFREYGDLLFWRSLHCLTVMRQGAFAKWIDALLIHRPVLEKQILGAGDFFFISFILLLLLPLLAGFCAGRLLSFGICLRWKRLLKLLFSLWWSMVRFRVFLSLLRVKR